MAKPKKQNENLFDEAIRTIRGTKKGQEAAMYGPLRDLFVDILGYPRSSVHIDIAGEAGHPDVTCRAPNGINDRAEKSLDIDWMVVEAEDEHDAFSTSGKRETDHAKAIDVVVNKIDALIGPALGLDTADIASIRNDMTDDPFLKNITPRWPATETRIHGYRMGLDSSDRYN